MDKNKNIISEDFSQDKKYRDAAKSMAYAIAGTLRTKNQKIKVDEEYIYLDITDIYTKNAPFQDGNNCYILFVKNADPKILYSYIFARNVGHLIVFNILPKSVISLYNSFIKTHTRSLNTLFNKYPSKDQTVLVSEEFKKFLRSKFFKIASENLVDDISPLVHECIHLFDKSRMNKTYKEPKINYNTKQGIDQYYNDNLEQNAFFQQTTFLLDKWLEGIREERKITIYNSFNEFFKDFAKVYRGSYDQLTPENKKRLAKRAFSYYQRELKRQKYQDFTKLNS